MRILFLTQILPYPLDAGPKARNYYVLRYLAQKNQIYLISFIRSTDSVEAFMHLKSFCEDIIPVPIQRSRIKDGLALFDSFYKQEPFLIKRDKYAIMSKAISHLIQRTHFDAIHADQLWMAQYALQAKQEAPKNGYSPLLVLDQHNAVFQVPLRMAEQANNPFVKFVLENEARQLARYEVETCQQFDRVVWVTKEDEDAVRKQSLINNFHTLKRSDLISDQDYKRNNVIPICIDPSIVKREELREESNNLLFLGGMHWPPNAAGIHWFAHDIFPLVKKEIPKARLVVVGKQPPEDLQRVEGVTVTGYVDDTTEYWHQSRVFIVPLKAAGGMRVKILDAWAHGIPVVSTLIGAEGIDFIDRENILIANNPDQFSKAICQLLKDIKFSQKIGIAGRNRVECSYNWRKVYPLWDNVYRYEVENENY
jgi:polysaccharide biosynthesis protein PslH